MHLHHPDTWNILWLLSVRDYNQNSHLQSQFSFVTVRLNGNRNADQVNGIGRFNQQDISIFHGRRVIIVPAYESTHFSVVVLLSLNETDDQTKALCDRCVSVAKQINKSKKMMASQTNNKFYAPLPQNE